MTKLESLEGRIVWTVSAKSESGDNYGVIAVLDHKPTNKELQYFSSEESMGADGWSNEPGGRDGPGTFGSYVYLDIEEHTIKGK